MYQERYASYKYYPLLPFGLSLLFVIFFVVLKRELKRGWHRRRLFDSTTTAFKQFTSVVQFSRQGKVESVAHAVPCASNRVDFSEAGLAFEQVLVRTTATRRDSYARREKRDKRYVYERGTAGLKR